MSITVTFLSFTKRENSTKTPTASQISSGLNLSCTLIDDTSIMNPTFKIQAEGSFRNYNYCYVSHFNRYYFITDIRSYQNFWHVSCSCDVLASYKSAIGSGSHYVLRSASESDGNLTDSMYPAKIAANEFNNSPATDLLDWSSSYSYVVGIVGNTDNSSYQVGSMVYYHMDAVAFNGFMTFLMDNIDDWCDLSGEYSEGVEKALINPMQYIKTCIALPIDPPEASSSSTIIKLGYYEITMSSGSKIKRVLRSNLVASEGTTISVHKHPQAATRGNYLNCQPFSEYTLHFDPWGDIPIDPALLQENDSIQINLIFDLTNGLCRLRVGGDSSHASDVFFIGSTQVGVNVNLSQIYVDGLAQTKVETNAVFSMMSGMAGIVGAGLSGNIPGAVSGVINNLNTATNGIQDATRLNYPVVSGIGSSGSFITLSAINNLTRCFLKHKYYEIVDENNAEIGRPLCKVKQINTLSGFIVCSGADCQITGTQEEAIKVNGYMNTGFFYE